MRVQDDAQFKRAQQMRFEAKRVEREELDRPAAALGKAAAASMHEMLRKARAARAAAAAQKDQASDLKTRVGADIDR